MNTFGYAGGNPFYWVDPYGLEAMDWLWGTIYDATGGWSPSQATVDIAAGFGDGISFGITKGIRKWQNIDGGVNECSENYNISEFTGNFVLPSAATLKIGKWFKTGKEFTLNPKKFRLAPFGNRTGHPTGRWPHYHRRGVDKSGKTKPGQSVKRHRPWDTKSTDKSFLDRF